MPKTTPRCAVSRCAPDASQISGPAQRGKQRRSASLIDIYDDVSRQFHEFLVTRGYPVDPTAIERQHVEEF